MPNPKRQLGGYARAKKLTAQRRSEIASNAALARWTIVWLRSNNRKVVKRNLLTRPVFAE